MSSEALERTERIRENISHVARGCRSASSHNPAPYLNSIEAALVALLAEVGRLEQERDAYRDRESEVNIERQRNEVRAELAEAALAVAREREQRAVEKYEVFRDQIGSRGCMVEGCCCACKEDAARAALVDEPAAATLAEPGYAASVMWQHMCAELIRDAAPNWLRATLVGEPCSECGKTEDEARGDEPAVPGRYQGGTDGEDSTSAAADEPSTSPTDYGPHDHFWRDAAAADEPGETP